MIGQKFHSLTVIASQGKDKHGHRLWLCECECGGEKVVTSSDIRSRVKSCGCQKIQKGEMNPNWSGGKKELLCDYCGKKFVKYESKTNAYKFNFCGNECRHKHYAENTRGVNNHRYKGGLQKINCDYCGKVIEKCAADVRLYRKHFCDSKCLGKWNTNNYSGHKNPNWKGGKSFEPYPVTWSHQLREMIRDRDGRKCQVCLKDEGRERLSVHHIDYCKSNVDPLNLVSLCHDCHCKTNSNRFQWLEYFLCWNQQLNRLVLLNNQPITN